MGAEQRRRGVGGENRPRQLWRRVQGSPPAQQPGRGRQDLQGDAAGRTKEEVPAGGPHTQAVRAPQHCPLHRDMCAEAAHHDCDGAGAGRLPSQLSPHQCG